MAKLKGIFQFEGTLGEVTSYKGANGEQIIRRKGGVSKEQFNSLSSMQRTRENASEFGSAATAGKLIRRSLKVLTGDFVTSATGLITKKMRELLNLDATNPRGQRKVSTANLLGFEAGLKITKNVLSEVARVPAVITFPGTDGTVSANLALSGVADLVIPQGATHYRVGLAFGVVNLENEESRDAIATPTAWTSVSAVAPASLAGNWNGVANADDLMIAVLYVEFAQQVNGAFYPIGGKYYEMKSELATA